MQAFPFCLLILAFVGCLVWAQSTTPAPCAPANECVKDLTDAMVLSNLTDACSQFEKSARCFAGLDKTCPQQAKMFQATQVRVVDDEFKVGCEGACAKAAETCLGDMMSVLSGGKDAYTLLNCQKVTASLNCLENITAEGCKGAVKKAIVFISKFTKENEFSDICDHKGNPTKCFNDFVRCNEDLAGIDDTTPRKESCQKMETYLQCLDGLPCRNALKTKANDQNIKITALEQQYKCATVGTCNQRMVHCASNLLTAFSRFKNDTKNKDKICTDLGAAIKCIDVIAKDKTCKLEKVAIVDQEKEARKLYGTECGAASAVMNSTALLALGLAMSIFKNYF